MIVLARTIAGLLIAANAIVASAANFVVNPDFTTDTSGWTLFTNGAASATFESTSGSPSTGSIRLQSSNGGIAQARQCTAITPQNVDVYTRQFANNVVPPINEANFNVIAYDGPNCTGSALLSLIAMSPVSGFAGFLNGNAQTWEEASYVNHALPNETVSVLISLYVQANASGIADYYFDDVRLTPSVATPVKLQTFDVE